MAAETHDFDLGALRLSSGEGRRLELDVPIEPLELGGERYAADPAAGTGRARRLAHDGRRLCAAAALLSRAGRALHALPEAGAADRRGRCARGRPTRRRARSSKAPTSIEETLDLAGWARDAFALAMPSKVLCREDCAGLCPVCAADLNEVRPRAPPRERPRSALGEAARAEARVVTSGRCGQAPPRAGAGGRRAGSLLHVHGGPQEKAIAQPHRQAARAAQDRRARAQRVPAVPQPATAAPGVPGVRHLRRP